MIVEYRSRSKRIPKALFPTGEIRLYLGEASNRKETAVLNHRREILKKIARRGQWEVFVGIRDNQLTVEEVVRIVDESGLDTLHLTLQDPGAGESLGQLVPIFLADLETEPTRVVYEMALRRLTDHVGRSTPWDRVGRHEINEVLDSMRAEGLAANTRAQKRAAWSSFFTWAIDRDEALAERDGRPPRGQHHPVRKSKRVRVATTRHRFLTMDELDLLIAASSAPMQVQYLALAFTGMRLGEFVSRRPEEVEDRVIRIYPRDGWSPKGWPKVQHGVRDIPIERRRLLPALEEYREKWAGDQTFFVNPRTLEPWRPDSFRRQLKRDLEAVGLIYGRDHTDGVIPHTFRHSLASWLAQKDVQLMKIAQLLGDTLATVAKYYAHLLPRDLDLTINQALNPHPVSEKLTEKTEAA